MMFPVLASAQLENSVWYFGDHAGLDFSSGSPVALTNGMTNAPEGTACISDNLGNILFYTDGVTVWNSTHAVMSNGNGLFGHFSSSQSAQIVKKPGSNDLYYIFTLYELAGATGFNYSIVNMSLQNGLGQVVTKNVFITNNVTEKIAIIPHCNQVDAWVIVHRWNSDSFLAYELTSSGLNTSPVTSSVGTVHQGGTNPNWNTVGCMRASKDGSKIALAIRDANLFECLDFDNSTGIVSNAVTCQSFNYAVAYGVEFSADGSKLYGTSATNGTIYQFDLNAGSPAAIAASATFITNTASNYTGAMLLGPDDKIYVARSASYYVGASWLGVINSPNAAGTACNYMDNGVPLAGKLSLMGMPSYTHLPSPCTQDTTGNNDTTIVITPPPPPPLPEALVTVPNVFTPNADGVNDAFIITYSGLKSAYYEIYNRWGQKLFESNSLDVHWNGTAMNGSDVPDGVYYYIVSGMGEDEKEYKFTGFVQLIREQP
jgi:gliding motility-associated-like protein